MLHPGILCGSRTYKDLQFFFNAFLWNAQLQYYLVFVFTVITAHKSRHAKFDKETDYINKFYTKDCLHFNN